MCLLVVENGRHMTDPEPIPPAEFSAALEALNRAAFASFVGELRAVTADEVDVDPPLVTVRTGETRTELLVGPCLARPDDHERRVDDDLVGRHRSEFADERRERRPVEGLQRGRELRGRDRFRIGHVAAVLHH